MYKISERKDNKWHDILKNELPKNDDSIRTIFQCPYNELEGDFLCFEDVYGELSRIIPKDKVILDLGCYVGLQGFFFKEHKGYIGIDMTPDKDNGDIYMPRAITVPNSTFIVSKIEDYLDNLNQAELLWHQNNCFAIMSYVPNQNGIWDRVKATFPNVAGFYPDDYNLLRLDGKTYDFDVYNREYMDNLYNSLKEKDVEYGER